MEAAESEVWSQPELHDIGKKETERQMDRERVIESILGAGERNHFNLYVYTKTKFNQKLTSMLTSKKEKGKTKNKTKDNFASVWV